MRKKLNPRLCYVGFKNQDGFTFIELILYISLLTIILSALIPFAWNIIEGSVKSSAQQEVFGNARYVSEIIKYEIRNSIGINSISATSISLVNSVGANNPTVIDLSAGKIRIKKGAAAVVNLNSTDTNVTALTFTNYTSGTNTTENIQFTFTIDDNYTGPRQEYQVPAVLVQGDAEVRSN